MACGTPSTLFSCLTHKSDVVLMVCPTGSPEAARYRTVAGSHTIAVMLDRRSIEAGVFSNREAAQFLPLKFR